MPQTSVQQVLPPSQRFGALLGRIPRDVIGETLYRLGFWVEYAALCIGRVAVRVAKAVGGYAVGLLRLILHPLWQGVRILLHDLTQPFVWLLHGVRHLRGMTSSDPNQSAEALRAEKVDYLRRGARRALPILWNALSYLLPVGAAVLLFTVVRAGSRLHFVLNVQVDGETVGFVQSEQVFESARADVQSRINNARAALLAAGDTAVSGQLEVSPTYTLAIGDDTMNESEMANAIMLVSSNEIGEGTAVYIDGSLHFVTTEGDHLRTYLEHIKEPYEDAMDANTHVSFVHDIRLVDGIYLSSSIVPYRSIVEAFNNGAEVRTYTAVEGETAQSAVDATGVSWDSLAMMNPTLLSLDQEIPAGTELVVGASSPEWLKVKVVRRRTYEEDILFNTTVTDSDEYDFGKEVVLQEGETGLQEITQDITYIDDVPVETTTVEINVVKQPVDELIVRGTKLRSGMVATVGSGSFIWPVPGYISVSRGMTYGHRGVDIRANYGTPIIASDGGAVVEAGYHYSWGNYVKIDHGNGYTTLYAHMSSIAVSAGQGVTQGQTIGYVGSTGNSTGNHCHFEMTNPSGALFSALTLFPGM